MLTRLEVSGFKNLLDVQVDFGPFTCIAGANGVGKSNVFDAIEFLSHLASDTLMEAAQRVRSLSEGTSADPRDLFWDGYRDHERVMHLAAEMIVPTIVEDDLGSSAEATNTFLRYEITLGYARSSGEASVGRLVLQHEELHHIKGGDTLKHLRFRPRPKKEFRDSVIVARRRGGPFLSTEERDSGLVINIHGDGGSFGKPQPRAAARVSRTALSTITTNDHPTILAARKEMQSWRRLALEPSALRAPDSFADPRSLGSNGRHLAATLFRIAHESEDNDDGRDPDAVYAQVAGRLADLGDLGVESIDVEPDQKREVLTLFLHERTGMRLPARALSEGTLRFLALCVLLEDPSVHGVICMEEPENGIHPANLKAMLDLVRDLAVDPNYPLGDDNPFRQVIVNTHSPGVVQLCSPEDLLFAENRRQTAPDGTPARGLSLLPLAGTWRSAYTDSQATKADMLAYLAAPAGKQFSLPVELVG